VETKADPARTTLTETLHALCRRPAAETTVATLTIGLGYTAVEIASGDVGLSSTMLDPGVGCTRVRTYRDYEGRSASETLDLLHSDDMLERSLGIATVNALNRHRALSLPSEQEKDEHLRHFGVTRGTRVAMVGYFGPVVAQLETLGTEVRVLDWGRDMGDESQFVAALATWPELLILTATTILSASFERFLDAVGESVRVSVLGPTTPMVPSAYDPFPVHRIGGMVPLENDRVLAAVRQGAGTPVLSRFCRKVRYTFDRP